MIEQETVRVPAFVGLDVAHAHEIAFTGRLVLVAGDPDARLPVAGIISAQAPEAGAPVPAASSIAIAVDTGPPGPGGGGGSRPVEPPPPEPLDAAGTT